MIITLTANPSLDRTLSLDRELLVGQVHRVTADYTDPGGKGINVSRVCLAAGMPTQAVFPAPAGDKFAQLLGELGMPSSRSDALYPVRTNLTVIDRGEQTTKINENGGDFGQAQILSLLQKLQETVAAACPQWVVLAGSLPPGVADSFYLDCLEVLAPYQVRVAIDTSEAPLRKIAQYLQSLSAGESITNYPRPNLLKPNAFELGELVGVDGVSLEKAAENGDYQPTLTAVGQLLASGVEMVLVTLGAGGALVATANQAWVGHLPARQVASTVGAGDSSLAGFLLAQVRGESLEECLRKAVAYGTAAVEKSGTQAPVPADLRLKDVKTQCLFKKG